MTDRTDPNLYAFLENPATSNVTELATGNVPAHFLDVERVALYLTLAGLIEAGVDTEMALALVETEARAKKNAIQAERLSEFFQTVKLARDAVKSSIAEGEALPADIIGETAEICFGRNFASSDEIVLLRGLAHTDNIPAILKAAAGIVMAKSSIYTPARPASIPGRRLK
jgi:hypothetical protein|nr:hypothetical protein [Neorhizobium tomejilense]